MVGVHGFKVFDPALGGAAVEGGGNVTGAGTYVSRPTNMRHAYLASYVVSFVGALLNGVLTVEVTNDTDDDLNLGSGNGWSRYTEIDDGSNTGIVITGGKDAAGDPTINIDLTQFTFGRVRLKFVRTAGTGTVTARLAEKG